jgi:hypothetical protein
LNFRVLRVLEDEEAIRCSPIERRLNVLSIRLDRLRGERAVGAEVGADSKLGQWTLKRVADEVLITFQELAELQRRLEKAYPLADPIFADFRKQDKDEEKKVYENLCRKMKECGVCGTCHGTTKLIKNRITHR